MVLWYELSIPVNESVHFYLFRWSDCVFIGEALTDLREDWIGVSIRLEWTQQQQENGSLGLLYARNVSPRCIYR